MMSHSAEAGAVTAPALRIAQLTGFFLKIGDGCAGLLLGANICVVCFTVICRYILHEQFPWADEVARALLVALAFFGGATAIGHQNTIGIEFFRDRLPPRALAIADAFVGIVVMIVSLAIVYHGTELAVDTRDQTTASGLPENIFDVPMVIGGVFMAIYSLGLLSRSSLKSILAAAVPMAAVSLLWWVADAYVPAITPGPLFIMAVTFVVTLVVGVPIGYVLAFSALAFMSSSGTVALEAFAQQGAHGTDNFVLLAVPFFMLTGFVMDANGMSKRLVNLLLHLMGHVRGGINVVMVLSMTIFSGVSGSKLADVAAVGAVLVPAAKRNHQPAADAVALLAASAVMAETIPPCVNLIILGYVANVSIGGLFVAGLIPAGFMALALIVFVVLQAPSRQQAKMLAEERLKGMTVEERQALVAAQEAEIPKNRFELWCSGTVTFGMIAIIFVGFRMGFATATEISAFAVVYAIVVGGLAFREFTVKSFLDLFASGAARAGMVMFIIGMSQAFAFVLTLQQIPHHLGQLMVEMTAGVGTWVFLLMSIVLLIVMGALLEGAAALIIFCPLLVPIGTQLGFSPLHYGLLLIVGMGVGYFAPPLGLGLYTSCAIGQVSVEAATKPALKYLGVMFVCLLVLAYVPQISLMLPHYLGYTH
jgi:tripartite ATP-independent transporter DctM subunit